jgi:hypothetical protein
MTKEMTRDDLYEYVRALDSPLRMMFELAQTIVREADVTLDGSEFLTPEYQIAKAIYDVFDGFAQRWFDEQNNQEE